MRIPQFCFIVDLILGRHPALETYPRGSCCHHALAAFRKTRARRQRRAVRAYYQNLYAGIELAHGTLTEDDAPAEDLERVRRHEVAHFVARNGPAVDGGAPRRLRHQWLCQAGPETAFVDPLPEVPDGLRYRDEVFPFALVPEWERERRRMVARGRTWMMRNGLRN